MPRILNRRTFLGSLSLAGLTGLLGFGGIERGLAQAPRQSEVQGAAAASRRLFVFKDDPDYERWRQGMAWQEYKHARYPDVIACPSTLEDISTALAYATRNQLRVACRSGGHNVSGAFYRDGGLLLDLSRFKGVQVHEAQGTGWVAPGIWSRNLALALSRSGFAFPYAHCATVPMGGYLLGGGVGVNGDTWGGVACSNVIGAKVLLADGSQVRVNETAHPDLFWALRGAGTGFPGVVAAYHLQLHPAPASVLSSAYVFPMDAAAEAANWLSEVRDHPPEDVELMMLTAQTPDGPVAIVRFMAFCASEADARQRLKHVAAMPKAKRAAAAMEHIPTTIEQSFMESVDATRGLGFGSYGVETIWTNGLPDAVAAMIDHFKAAPSAMTHLLISPRIRDATPSNAAFSRIGKSFLGAYAVWKADGPQAAVDNFAWLGEATKLMAPHALGRYVNETDGFADKSRVRSAFTHAAWRRLRKVQGLYDPQGRFFDFPGWC